MLTLADRAAAYNAAFPQWPPSHLRVVQERDRGVIYGTWVFGNSYRNKAKLYGAYPANYLLRLMAMFPDATPDGTLHVFSGALPPGPYRRCDIMARPQAVTAPEYLCDVLRLPALVQGRPFSLVPADPPYTPADADVYETPMVNKRLALRALAQVTAPGGFVAWLDTCWPMHRRDQWETAGRLFVEEVPIEHAVDDADDIPELETAGRVAVVRSTNHRVRLLTLFERTDHE